MTWAESVRLGRIGTTHIKEDMMDIATQLTNLGIEYQPKAKYYTTCPKCGKDRKRGTHTKSLAVFLDDEVTRYKCLHANQCEWNATQVLWGKPMDTAPIAKEEFKFKPIPADVPVPMPNDATGYEYKDVNGNLLFVVVRTKDKKFFPMAYTDEGEFVSRRPDFKTLFGAELLNNDSPVLVVEGEKTALAARDIFTKANVVTWVGGAANVKQGDWRLLNNREVILWPDNDEAGVKAMSEISSLINSSNISIIDVSSLPPKADLADDIGINKIKELYHGRRRLTTEVAGSLSMAELLEQVGNIKTGLPLGWNVMDKTLRLPQSGLTIVEGRSGHGKTTFMLNAAVHMLEKTDRPVVYISYEIPAARMLLKMLMVMEGEQLDVVPHKNEELYRERLLSGNLRNANKLESYLQKRLFVTDSDLGINEIVKTLDKDSLQDAIVFIDYIQLIPAKGTDSRYLVIKNFADSLRAIGNKRNQVVITGSQLTNGETPYQDQAREGKDITNAAELVLKVWNKDVAAAHDVVQKKKVKDGEDEISHYYDDVAGNFTVDVKKNRNGKVGQQYGFNLMFGTVLREVADEYKDF